MSTLLGYIFLLVLWIQNTFSFGQYAIKGLSLRNIALLLLVCAILVRIAVLKRPFKSNNLNKYIYLLMFVYTLGVFIKFVNIDYFNVKLLKEIVVLKNVLEPSILFIVFYNIIDNEATCRKLLLGLTLIFLLSVIIVLSVVLDFRIIGVITREHGGYWPKFAEPNQYAAYLVLMMPLLFSGAILAKKTYLKVLVGLCGIMGISALICSGSRGGMLSFVFSCILYGFLILKRNILKKNLVITFIVTIVLLLSGSIVFLPTWVVDRSKERIITRYEESTNVDYYSSGRIRLWKFALEIFVDKAIFGYGQGGFAGVYKKKHSVPTDCHNTYLNYMVDYGIIGLTAFILFCREIFYTVKRRLRESCHVASSMVYISFLSGFFGFLIAIFFINIYSLMSFVFIYIAVIYKYMVLESTKTPKEARVENLC